MIILITKAADFANHLSKRKYYDLLSDAMTNLAFKMRPLYEDSKPSKNICIASGSSIVPNSLKYIDSLDT